MVIEQRMSRRRFLKRVGAVGLFALYGGRPSIADATTSTSPNIILCMCDDLGWGDVGYHRKNPDIKTPQLDRMAQTSLQFSRFYAGAPVCSPTRGSVITGRHPLRYGITHANVGHMTSEEITLAEAVKPLGYRTGHFGKWHLGTLTTETKDSNRGGASNKKDYSPPWDNGFDVCFSTEAKVPTWNPMVHPGTQTFYGTYYWQQDGAFVPHDDPRLQGDDSRVIMDQALTFITESAEQQTPFLAVIWFHAPHKPVVAGPRHKAMYKGFSEAQQHYFGCITAMDEQVGRLREQLKALGVSRDTLLWFTSDNGPENNTPGITGGFRKRKRSLYEGGVRVPGLVEWPAVIKEHKRSDMPCSTSDYFPTLMDVLGFRMPDPPRSVDGISLVPLLNGHMEKRPVPIGFIFQKQRSLTDNQYKLYSADNGVTFELYDLMDDPYEKNDLAASKPERVDVMKTQLQAWIESCHRSEAGNDYKQGV